ncbi:MAG: beta-lactamase family protein [Asticcacaulis sp.]|nr:beta-lactamase family protein [Asticcacaulis sp.]
MITGLLALGAGSAFAGLPPKAATSQTVTQAGQSGVQVKPAEKPVFGANAVFPTAVISDESETRSVNDATATLTLKVHNHEKVKTDPAWLAVSDGNVLMEPAGTKVALPSLAPGESKTVVVTMKAKLTGTTFAAWTTHYDDACGANYRLVLDWRGPQAQTPFGEHIETVLKEANGHDQPGRPICDDTQCVVPCDVIKTLRQNLDGHVVGYAYFIGRDTGFFKGGGGNARTAADGSAVPFGASTKVTVASVSKLVSAIAAVRLLDKKGVALTTGIGPYLPADWTPGTYVKGITFKQLLSQQSGIKDYGNVSQAYAGLKTFYDQNVAPGGAQTCKNSSVQNPPNPINPNNTSPCYSNYNFSIFRILLPKVNGNAEDSSQATRPGTLAAQYISLVQQNEFDLVGAPNVSCAAPVNSTYAFAYIYPGSKKGFDWGDNSLQCGAAGWYLSVDDMSKVMVSLANGDGKILVHNPYRRVAGVGGLQPAGPVLSGTAGKDLFQTMKDSSLGFDEPLFGTPNPPYPEFEKNGGWSANCDANGNNCEQISTSVAVFGPGVVGILFLNSNVSGGPESGQGAAKILEDAYYAALKPKP